MPNRFNFKSVVEQTVHVMIPGLQQVHMAVLDFHRVHSIVQIWVKIASIVRYRRKGGRRSDVLMVIVSRTEMILALRSAHYRLMLLLINSVDHH